MLSNKKMELNKIMMSILSASFFTTTAIAADINYSNNANVVTPAASSAPVANYVPRSVNPAPAIPVTPPGSLPVTQAQQVSPMASEANSASKAALQNMGARVKVDEKTAQLLQMLNTPNEKIREFKYDMYEKDRVVSELPVTPAKSVISTVIARVEPGSTPPVIRLYKNRASTVLFTDSTGAPWPIVNYAVGSSQDFAISRLDKPAPLGSMLTITPNDTHVSGNLTVALENLNTPVVLEFVSAQQEWDARADVRVQSIGPNARLMATSLPDAADSRLLSVLQGVAPEGAKPLRVSTPSAQVWLAKDGKMFVRTRYSLMSPAFEDVTSSPDGTFAYKMIATPIILFKYENNFGEIYVDGF